MSGFLKDNDGNWSMTRLCMLIGTVGGVVVGYREVSHLPEITIWMAALIPFTIMLGGCLPYIFNKVNEIKNKALDNPELIAKIAKAIKGK